jgi:hypothetical protein
MGQRALFDFACSESSDAAGTNPNLDVEVVEQNPGLHDGLIVGIAFE